MFQASRGKDSYLLPCTLLTPLTQDCLCYQGQKTQLWYFSLGFLTSQGNNEPRGYLMWFKHAT